MRRMSDEIEADTRTHLTPDALTLRQRRIGYEITETPGTAAVLIGEHPRGVTLGRAASRLHVRLPAEELHARDWQLSWVARAAGPCCTCPAK